MATENQHEKRLQMFVIMPHGWTEDRESARWALDELARLRVQVAALQGELDAKEK